MINSVVPSCRFKRLEENRLPKFFAELFVLLTSLPCLYSAEDMWLIYSSHVNSMEGK
jgi:hypothetical protein